MPGGTGTLAERLQSERRRTFVGRAAQIELFRTALTDGTVPPFHLLYVHGPAGTGKSTLLAELAALCVEHGCEPVRLDGGHLSPVVDSFLDSLSRELNVDQGESPVSHLWSRARKRRHVLLIDTYEAISALDDWLRETFLPQLPEDTLTVIAGRHPLPMPWRTDAGWSKLVRVESLDNLPADEAEEFLSMRGVPSDQYETIIRFTQGHPLALSLIADVFAQQPDFQFAPERALDVIQELINRLIEGAPGPLHRQAVRVAALTRVTTEELLAATVSEADAQTLFEWLKNMSFADVSYRGLVLHDLAREAIATDFRWRSPRSYEQTRRQISDYYGSLLQSGSPRQQEESLKDYLFLHRDREAVRLFLESGPQPASHQLAVADASADEHETIVEMVLSNEGEASAAIARHWLERQPDGAVLFKDSTGEIAGFMMILNVHDVQESDLRIDPGVRAAYKHLEQAVPLQSGEAATFVRFWMTKGEYQSVSSTQATLFRSIVRHCLTVSNLAFTFLCCADIDFWGPLLGRSLFVRLPEADFRVGDNQFGMLGHDWRPLPPRTWLALWAEGRRVAALSAAAAKQRHGGKHGAVTMTRAELRTALREFLREWHNEDQLGDTPLLKMKIVRSAAGGDERAKCIAALKTLLSDMIDGFNRSPRRQRLYRALYYTYIEPRGSQEMTAEFLDLPYSTYRDHVTTGIDLMRDMIWHQEFDGGAE